MLESLVLVSIWFPYAALAELTLWAIAPDFMKFTDNTLGFGKKLIWNNR